MADAGSITHLVQMLRSNRAPEREEAAQRIWERYIAELLSLVHRRLDRRIRARLDADDVVQSVWNSFFERQRRGDFELDGRDELRRLLVTIAIRKTHNASKGVGRQARNPRLEEQRLLEELASAEPTAEQAAMVGEELDRLANVGRDPDLPAVALARLAGWTHEEIAVQLGCSKRTVDRKVALVRMLLEEDFNAGE